MGEDSLHGAEIRHGDPEGSDSAEGRHASIRVGSAAKRAGSGFGSGASELRTAVEGFQMTAQGVRKLGSGTVPTG